jgi:hypothetical protein
MKLTFGGGAPKMQLFTACRRVVLSTGVNNFFHSSPPAFVSLSLRKIDTACLKPDASVSYTRPTSTVMREPVSVCNKL